MNDRIKSLRKQLGLTQEEFAARIRVKRGAIANYEIGRNEPVDSVLSLICREFSVNEQWLRTGEGEMFLPKSRNEELLAFVEQLAGSDSNDIRVQIATIMARLSSEEWEIVSRIANEFLKLNAQAEEC